MTDTDERMIREIARLCSLPESRVERTVTLLQGGATIPFITRYRKEATGGLDEVQVGAVRDQLERLNALEARKRTVRSAIEAAGKMTGALSAQLDDCWDGDKLEALYLPYKPKRRTRAAAAREKGLEPLAALLMRQDGSQPERLADRFVRGEVADREQALAGACDIVAEWVAENARAREAVRAEYARAAVLSSRAVAGREDEGAKYSDYFGRSFPLRRMPSHRLAMHLLRMEPRDVELMSESISRFRTDIRYCSRCNNLSDDDLCEICADTSRDASTVCVVEQVKDLLSIENTRQYNGLYHVLGGVISPMQGIGPSDLKIDLLLDRIARGDVREVILALSTTVEGETTSFYITRRLSSCEGVRVTSIARGIGFGDELDYADELTIAHAIHNRRPV